MTSHGRPVGGLDSRPSRTRFQLPNKHDASGATAGDYSGAPGSPPARPATPVETLSTLSKRPSLARGTRTSDQRHHEPALASTSRSHWADDADLKHRAEMLHAEKLSTWATFVFAYQCLGVIYGDIGTSPLYVYATAFPHGVESETQVLGALSIIIWTVTIIMLAKYIGLIMFMDDNGEGGTFSIYTLLCRAIGITPSGTMNMGDHKQMLAIRSVRPTDASTRFWKSSTGSHLRRWFRRSPRAQMVLMLVVTVATGLVLADGVLTPAISVMSAVSGLQEASSAITTPIILVITELILVALFLSQSLGTATVGHAFAPIVTLWLLSNSAIGIFNIVTYDATVFRAFNPYYIYSYFKLTGKEGWESLGGLMLCITGTEAMFADMGHFSRKSIQLSACVWVYPALLLTYIGQAAYLSRHPEDIARTYYASLPDSLFYPMLILATFTSIVASQALITGAFSIIRQCMRLGLCPKLNVVHTSTKTEGQIYIAEVNYILMILCVVVVAAFQSTEKLGNAYGVAVMAVMIITTFLAALVMLVVWELHWLIVTAVFLVLFAIEMLYWSASLIKVPEGGWFPLVVAFVLVAVMLTWWAGERRKKLYRAQHKTALEDLLVVAPGSDGEPALYLTSQPHKPLARPSGLGIYYSDSTSGTPVLLSHLLSNTSSLHDVVVLLTVRFLPLPYIPCDERLLVRVLPTVSDFYQVVVRYGYQETVDHGTEFVRFMVSRIIKFSELSQRAPASAFVRNHSLRPDTSSPPLSHQRPTNTHHHQLPLSTDASGSPASARAQYGHNTDIELAYPPTLPAAPGAGESQTPSHAHTRTASGRKPGLDTINDTSDYEGDDSRPASLCGDDDEPPLHLTADAADMEQGVAAAAAATALEAHLDDALSCLSAPAWRPQQGLTWGKASRGSQSARYTGSTTKQQHDARKRRTSAPLGADGGGGGGGSNSGHHKPVLLESLSNIVMRNKRGAGGGGEATARLMPSAARDEMQADAEDDGPGGGSAATGGGVAAGGSAFAVPGACPSDALSSGAASFRGSDDLSLGTREAQVLLDALQDGVVYYVARDTLRVPEKGRLARRVLYNQLYGTFDRNSWADHEAWHIPTDQMMALNIIFNIV